LTVGRPDQNDIGAFARFETASVGEPECIGEIGRDHVPAAGQGTYPEINQKEHRLQGCGVVVVGGHDGTEVLGYGFPNRKTTVETSAFECVGCTQDDMVSEPQRLPGRVTVAGEFGDIAAGLMVPPTCRNVFFVM